jgi:hypothetical protein
MSRIARQPRAVSANDVDGASHEARQRITPYDVADDD